MMIKTDIESALRIALEDEHSILPQYDAYDDPANWVPYSGQNINDFDNGEVVLIAWDATADRGQYNYWDWTFRKVNMKGKTFERRGGVFSEPSRDRWHEYHIYRYQACVTDETELSSASLEEIL